MNTVETRDFFNQQGSLAIWQAEYDGSEESVVYANPLFCEIFSLTLDEVLARRRYHLVNPPDTAAETIAEYRAQDREAMKNGYFLHRSSLGDGQDIIVLKLRFDQGILGMFKFVASDLRGSPTAPSDLDADFRGVLEKVNQ